MKARGRTFVALLIVQLCAIGASPAVVCGEVAGSRLVRGTRDRALAAGSSTIRAGAMRATAMWATRQVQDSVALTLEVAVRRALATHPGAVGAEADVRRAEALVAEARSARLPRIVIEGSGTRFQEPMIVAPLHGFNPMQPPEFDATLLQGRASADWLLFDGGSRGSRIDRSSAAAEAAGASRVQARQRVMESVVRAYIGVRSSRELLAAHQSLLVALEAERARAGRMLAAGSVPRVNVLRADAALSRARAEQAVRVSSLRQAEADLSRLIGTTLDMVSASRMTALALAPSVSSPSRDGVLALAARSSPSIERARAQLAAAEAGEAEARAANWPTLALSAGYNGFSSGSGHSVAEWQTGLRVSYPLFTGGARGAAARRTDAEADVARQAVRQAELDAATDVDRTLGDLVAAQAQADALSAAVDQFAAVADVESLSLGAGAGVQSDYLRAVSDLLDARAALTRARASEVGARVTLARLTGELSIDWLVANVESAR